MMKYNIVPNAKYFETIEAESWEEAMEKFAMRMDLDMNAYFKAVPDQQETDKRAKYIYDISFPVEGTYYAHISTNEQLTKEEAIQKAFEEGDFGDLENCDVGEYGTIHSLYAEGDFLEDEEREI